MNSGDGIGRKRETPAAHRRLHPMESARCLPVSLRTPLAGFESMMRLILVPSWSSAFPGGYAEFENRRQYAVRPDISVGSTAFMFDQIIYTFFVLFRVS
jgi:hypothetical protein